MTVVQLPSGARVRGRRMADVPQEPADFLLALAGGPAPTWEIRRIQWPDFGVPLDRADAIEALTDALGRARAGQLVEVACLGGRGRTGTALAALAVLDGMDPREAVPWVRQAYDRHAVETSEQEQWVLSLGD